MAHIFNLIWIVALWISHSQIYEQKLKTEHKHSGEKFVNHEL